MRASRRMALVLALGAVLVAAGCGGGGDEEQPATGESAATTVALRQAEGQGEVLVDDAGRALYVSEQEHDGKVRCVDACAQTWLPLEAPASGDPTGPQQVADALSVVKRPDGSRQVALDGAPLYLFADDHGPGEVTGDGLSDDFGGETFTWHVASPSGGGGDGGSPAPAGGYGY